MLLLRTKPPEIEMVTVPTGEFIMGEKNDAHSVALAEYQIGRYPITNAQYLPFLQDTGHPWAHGEFTFTEEEANYPVAGVTWADAWLYCRWLRLKTKQSYHLPTEAQWEKAATWHPTKGCKQPYPWGHRFSSRKCNLSSLFSRRRSPTPVGAYSPKGDSPYGCADMIGNVNEWCNTVMWEYPYQADDGREELWAQGRRCLRGGDYYMDTPVSGMQRNAPSDMWAFTWGFRVALSSALEEAHQRFMQDLDEEVSMAKAHFAIKIKEDPDNALEHHNNWAAWLLELRYIGFDIDYLEVKRDLTDALELIDDQISSKSFGGQAKKSPDEALLYRVYYHRALVRNELKDHEGAFTDITQAIELNPSDADGFCIRADIACDLECWEQAEQDLGQALKLHPQHHLAPLIQVRILKGQGKWQTALELLSKLIENPLLIIPTRRHEVHLWRAEIYEQFVKNQIPVSDYYHALLWHPKAPEADQIVRKMREYLQ